MADQETRLHITAYLQAHHVLHLATTGPLGPWAAPVFYAVDEALSLYFFSNPETRHGQNIGDTAQAAGSVAGETLDWRQIQGIQLEGLASRLQGDAEAEGFAVYLGRFPWAEPIVAKQRSKVSLYRLVPKRIALTDNTRAFGERSWLELGEV
jgi:uncharacterized protein YhbP (UPF0306 family)